MDGDDYDEFGNYIGPEIPSDNDGDRVHQEDEDDAWLDDLRAKDDNDQQMEDVEDESAMEIDVVRQNQIVLHEDKKYYPDAEEVFGQDVEAIVQEEDTQLLNEPIIAPIVKKSFIISEKNVPETVYSKEYMVQLTERPEEIRNIAIVGSLHHGKTALVDFLVQQTHGLKVEYNTKNEHSDRRYTDITNLERHRGISIKSQPISMLLPSSKGKNYLFNIMDTPGHVDFIDEVSAGLRISDGAILVVDAIEGVCLNTEKVIKLMLKEQTPFILLVNKIERLCIELKLPPADAYYKLKHTIEEVNLIINTMMFDLIKRNSDLLNTGFRVSPELGNVCFASTDLQFIFTLKSFAEMYCNHWKSPLDTNELAKRFWGDFYYDADRNKFTKSSSGLPRSFVHFIMEPVYKLISHTISSDNSKELAGILATVGLQVRKLKTLQMDIRPLLRTVCRTFFDKSVSSLVDQVLTNIPDPIEGGLVKVKKFYTGPIDGFSVGEALIKCDPNGPLVMFAVKQYPSEDGSRFDVLCRIFSGTLKRYSKVRVLGEAYTPDDEEDMRDETVAALQIYCSRYSLELSEVKCGNWVLVSGIEESIVKSATIVDFKFPGDEEAYIFRPLHLPSQSIVKVAVEPFQPSELPKMLEGLRKCAKSFLALQTKVEESGEHVLLGPGEIYMDSVMHDLRKVYSGIEVRISDPVVKFCETVVETSSLKCYAESPNKKNKLTLIAEPLDKQIATDLEVDGRIDRNNLEQHFRKEYGWDILAARGIWAFGPEDQGGTNILVDDCLPSEVDKRSMMSVKSPIVQGFQWGTREGPLCDETIRNTKFRILDVVLANDAISRGGGQIIPTARRVVYSSFLTATPRLMEPVYHVEIQTPSDCISAVYTLLARRRGHVVQDLPKAGSPLYIVKALLPVIDSFGFETDLRTFTHGQAFCQQVFDHWQIVPGDPLDKSIVFQQAFEPSPAQGLARDFMLKTRRRKGLSEDVSISKFFDDSLLIELAKQDILTGSNLL